MKLHIQTVEELVTIIQVCAWAFVVFVVMTVFGGTVFSMLYSVIFVSQPIKSMAPIDMAFTKMLNDIVLLLTGSITTLVGMFGINKGSKMLAEKLAPSLLPPTPSAQATISPTPTVAPTSGFNWMGFQNPDLDENWRPPPPPTTPPDHLHPEREEIAQERAAARLEGV
jgi:hypothetical protein